jgi:hypothetical protein
VSAGPKRIGRQAQWVFGPLLVGDGRVKTGMDKNKNQVKLASKVKAAPGVKTGYRNKIILKNPYNKRKIYGQIPIKMKT